MKYLLLFSIIMATGFAYKPKPVLYLIGDSTVATGSAKGDIQGWGGLLYKYIDTTRISIRNRAISGASSRTFYTGGVHDKSMRVYGLWQGVLQSLKPGDHVMMQFGHNDDAPIADSARSRGTLKGTGDDSIKMFNRFLDRNETVHTYGWYLSRFIQEAKGRGASVIVCSPVPKNRWKDGKVERVGDYEQWAALIAEKNRSGMIKLNSLVADEYDSEGEFLAGTAYFVSDKVHTNMAGADKNASIVSDAIKKMRKSDFRKYLKKNL
ncbi:MAG: lysophospholipase [Chitinophagaceae bacterium]|nr:lysophospholipase [Chitinophagaceae bacterium]